MSRGITDSGCAGRDLVRSAAGGFDEVGGGEVADLVPGVDRRGSQPDQDVGLTSACGADDRQILLCPNLFQARQVVEDLRWN